MNINNIGILLLNSINRNNSENKFKFIKEVDNYNKKKNDDNDKLAEDLNYYTANYENKRDENNSLYNEYIQKRFALYKNYIDSKRKIDLDNLFKLKTPVYNNIPDIYTKKQPRVFLH